MLYFLCPRSFAQEGFKTKFIQNSASHSHTKHFYYLKQNSVTNSSSAERDSLYKLCLCIFSSSTAVDLTTTVSKSSYSFSFNYKSLTVLLFISFSTTVRSRDYKQSPPLAVASPLIKTHKKHEFICAIT